MKFSGAFLRPGSFAVVVFLCLTSASHTFANSLIVGGWVPAKRDIRIALNNEADFSRSGEPMEVGVIEIDNNLPEYELVLDFADRYGNGDFVSEVRLQGLNGELGQGLQDPSAAALEAGTVPGRFVWRPGVQESATVKYQVRVMVTCNRSDADRPSMAVSMPMAY